MKILHIIPSYKPAFIYGGPIISVSSLAEEQVKLGHNVTVYTTTANGDRELDVEAGKEIDVDGVKVTYFKRITGDHTHISPALWRYLYHTVESYDAVHVHSWWNFLVIGAVCICRKKNVIPVISPRGMLSEYVMTSRNAFKKRLIHLFIGKYLLRNAKLVSTSNLEKGECQSIIPGADVANIFNIIRLPQLLYERTKNDVFKIGFISRIHDKKGLDLLIQALCKVSFPYRLFVAGEGEKEYLDFLKDLAMDCGNSEQIEWVGWKNGEEKFEFLSQLDLFALTSRNENFALVVAEALAVGTPVLVSDAVGLHDYITENDLGWVCSLEEENIVENLESIYNAKEKINTINRRSPKIIRVDFEGSQIANKYTELYKSIDRPLQIQL